MSDLQLLNEGLREAAAVAIGMVTMLGIFVTLNYIFVCRRKR